MPFASWRVVVPQTTLKQPLRQPPVTPATQFCFSCCLLNEVKDFTRLMRKWLSIFWARCGRKKLLFAASRLLDTSQYVTSFLRYQCTGGYTCSTMSYTLGHTSIKAGLGAPRSSSQLYLCSLAVQPTPYPSPRVPLSHPLIRSILAIRNKSGPPHLERT